MSAIEFPLAPSVAQEHTHIEDGGASTVWVCASNTPAVIWERKTISYLKADGSVPVTGQLVLQPLEPTQIDHAVRKDYVDGKIVDVAAISKIINTNNVVDVLIYDTSKDDNGGAWVDKANFQSWYVEAGAFPKLAIIVMDFTAGKIIISDGNNPDLPVWLEFDIATGNMFEGNTASERMTAKNGRLYHSSEGTTGIQFVDFIADSAKRVTTAGHEAYSGVISQRNDALGHSGTPTGGVLSSNSCKNIEVGSKSTVNLITVSTDLGVNNILEDETVFAELAGNVQLGGFAGSKQVSIEETTGNVSIWDTIINKVGDTPDLVLNSGTTPAILGDALVIVEMLSDEYLCAVGSLTGLTLITADGSGTVQITTAANSAGGDLLAGASDDIKALDFDVITNILSVCSGDTVSKFNGINLVSSEALAITSISTSNDKQLTGV